MILVRAMTDWPIAILIGLLGVSILLMLLLGAVIYFIIHLQKRLDQIVRILRDNDARNAAWPSPEGLTPSQLPADEPVPSGWPPASPAASATDDANAAAGIAAATAPAGPAVPGRHDDRLLAAVQTGDATLAETILKDIEHDLQAARLQSDEAAYQMTVALLDNLRQLLFDFNEDEAGNKDLSVDLAARLTAARVDGEYPPVIRHMTLLLLKNYQKRATQKKSEIVLQAKAFIEQNYQNPLTVNAIAAALFISAPYLYRLMREELGVSPAHYLNNLRLRHASMLLRGTARPIAQIAAESGFETEQCFFRLFRKQMNCTPGQYRERYRMTNDQV